jgi:hypothetical protein
VGGCCRVGCAKIFHPGDSEHLPGKVVTVRPPPPSRATVPIPVSLPRRYGPADRSSERESQLGATGSPRLTVITPP